MSGTSIIAQIFVPLKGGCTGSFESTLVKMPYCWKFRVAAHLIAKPSTLRKARTSRDKAYIFPS